MIQSLELIDSVCVALRSCRNELNWGGNSSSYDQEAHNILFSDPVRRISVGMSCEEICVTSNQEIQPTFWYLKSLFLVPRLLLRNASSSVKTSFKTSFIVFVVFRKMIGYLISKTIMRIDLQNSATASLVAPPYGLVLVLLLFSLCEALGVQSLLCRLRGGR